MSDYLEIALPYPPSVNHYWRHTKSGKHYISAEGRAFRAEVLKICKQFDPFIGAVKLKIEVYYPDNRSRDPDNLQKALFDGLTASGLIQDDSNKIIKDYRVIGMSEIRKGGMVVLKIKGVEDVL